MGKGSWVGALSAGCAFGPRGARGARGVGAAGGVGVASVDESARVSAASPLGVSCSDKGYLAHCERMDS